MVNIFVLNKHKVIMKKKNEVKKKLLLDKFKIAELKNLSVIVGGGVGGDAEKEGSGTAGGNKIPPVQ
jgi:hypothetical protein